MNDQDATSRAIVGAARAGYLARGLVYLIVGGLAVLAAVGSGGQTGGSRDALRSLLDQPLGDVLLMALAFGLLGYAVWRSIQATLDPDGHGTSLKGVAVRGALIVSAITHTLLAIFAGSLVVGADDGGGSGGSAGFTAWLMGQAFGIWLVAGVGIAVIAAGIAHGIKGAKARFERYMTFPPDVDRWAAPVCRFGLVVRGLVLVLTGGFFLIAAYQADPSEAGGLGEAFATLQEQPFGGPLLALVAVGLLAFGAYSVLESIYRRVDAPALLGGQAAW